MRTISDTLLAAQKSASMNPLYKIVLTKGATTYTYDKARILPSAHDEETYSHKATIVLSNHDGALDDIALKGFKGVISYGAISSAGEEYSACAPMWVIDQQFDSDPNKLTCTLTLVGAFDLMADDQACQSYIPEDDDTIIVKDLIDDILDTTLDAYGHCKAFDVVWDTGYDELADTYKPKGGFSVYVGGNRLAAVRRLLDYTSNIARWESDGKIHILKPVTSGETYDYEYSLDKPDHKFFSKAYKNTLVIPNRVYVISYEDDDPQYLGVASTDDYASLPAEVRKIHYIQAKLESNDEADDIAEALIAKAEMWSKRGSAEVPLNVGAEVFDYVKVTDSRQGDTRTGNLGYVHRRFGIDKWTMTFGFGNWLEVLRYRELLNKLETYTDSGNYFPRLQVGSLYAYLDEIKDGPELYIRQNYLHLDATGVYVSENTLYAIRVPGEAEHNLWKQDSAPTNKETGDFWLDTNYTPNKVMIWDGDSWEEATSEQLEEFGRATILRRLKSAALTADGLVVLDEVQEGTYGLVKYTDISAGHIILSTCSGDLDDIADGNTYGRLRLTDLSSGHIKLTDNVLVDGKWYNESGVVLDASSGIALYGGQGINAFRTFATEADYLAGTPVQVYIGTDGKLYAGAGKVAIDSAGVTIEGEAASWGLLKFKYSGGDVGFITAWHSVIQPSLYGLILASESGKCLYLGPGDHQVLPFSALEKLGSTVQPFYGGYFKSRLKIPVGTDMYD